MPRAAACEQVLQAHRRAGHRARAHRLVRPARRAARQDADGRTRVADALHEGLGLVSTLMLKDTSDRTAFKVFEPGLADELPGFGFANNLLLLPDPASFRVLPWAPATGWLQAQPWFDDGDAGATRHAPRAAAALARLADAGFGLRCGLEVEFHIYRIDDDDALDPEAGRLAGRAARGVDDPSGLQPAGRGLGRHGRRAAARSCSAPRRAWACRCVRWRSSSGPSQVEAVFDATDALTAADHMVLFRNGVRQALRRAGYHASFVCRPPFPNVMASGWHLHQSLVRPRERRQRCCAATRPRAGATRGRCRASRCPTLGEHYLAGLLAHGARDGGVLHAHDQRLRPLPPQRAGAAVGAVGRATTAARCCACSGAAATPARASRTASASRAPIRTSTSPRRSTPGSTASSAPSRAGGHRRRPMRAGGTLLPTTLGEALDALAGDARVGRWLRRAAHRLLHPHQARRAGTLRRRPPTRTSGSAANTSAASETTTCAMPATIADPPDRCRRRAAHDRRARRPEPDARRRRRRHRRHRGRLRRLPDLRHLPRDRRPRVGRHAAGPPSDEERECSR